MQNHDQQPTQSKRTQATPADLKERRRMLFALVLLLTALIAVALRNRQFWWPASSSGEEQESADPSLGHNSANGNHLKTVTAPANVRVRSTQHNSTKSPNTPPEITSKRTALPPLEVEVVAGNQHHSVQTQNSSIRVDIEPQSAATAALTVDSGSELSASDTSAGVQVTRGAAKVVSRPVKPDYPLLARQMKVQGAVVLQALIGKEGTIQDLQVLSGPSILSAAAREAVSQWRFKPYYEQGRQVETQARITVNFIISTY